MQPTSDERIEIASSLRHTRGIREFVDALGINLDSDWYWTDVSMRVADLIDPTCHAIERGHADEFHVCRSCGHETIVERCAGGWAEPPRYCSHCGSRLVGDDGGNGHQAR